MTSPAYGTTPERPALDVDCVSVTLAGRQILDQVSFTAGSGKLTGLIGPNGAGKTTLLRVILGLQRPASGQVRLPGPPAGRTRAVGYVPQKVLLDPDMPMRARDLVALGIDGHRYGLRLTSRHRADAVRQMLQAVGAARFADARVGALSGGEQQRILIAHALISSPKLLLLDEPLANLDLRSSQEIVALLARIAREQQVAVLLSAHDMNPLLPVTDRIVYLAGGRAASGPASDVVRTDVLSALYGHHVDVLHVHGRILVIAGDAPDGGAPDSHPPDIAVDAAGLGAGQLAEAG